MMLLTALLPTDEAVTELPLITKLPPVEAPPMMPIVTLVTVEEMFAVLSCVLLTRPVEALPLAIRDVMPSVLAEVLP